MTDHAPDPVEVVPTESAALGESAWGAYAELLSVLRSTIHLGGRASPIDDALEALFAIGEAWAVASESGSGVSLPFGRRSEIDLVATLLGVASYSLPNDEAFSRLTGAFVETVRAAPSTTHISFPPQ